MPQVKDLSLSVVFGPGRGVLARVEYDIEFFTKEIEHNIAFRELVAVIGQNSMLDHWLPRGADLRQIPPEHDEADGLVKYVYHGTVAPDDAVLVHRCWEERLGEAWERGHPRPGRERLRPLVYLTPLEITTNLTVGDEVQVDLGG